MHVRLCYPWLFVHMCARMFCVSGCRFSDAVASLFASTRPPSLPTVTRMVASMPSVKTLLDSRFAQLRTASSGGFLLTSHVEIGL